MTRKFIITLFLFTICMSLVSCKTSKEGVSEADEVKKHSQASAVNVQLGLGYLEAGNTERAKHKLLTALQQAPDSPVVNDAMAYYLEATGSFSEAEKYYKKSISLVPGKGESLNNYGTFLCRQKKYEQAEAYFLKAIKDPNYLSSAEAYENAGLCALKITNAQKARNYFERALQQDPRRATSLYELASLDFQANNYQQANQRLTSFFMMREPDAESSLLAYRVAKKLGDTAKATNYANLIQSKYSTSKENQLLRTGVN